jgi:hypothetical protein
MLELDADLVVSASLSHRLLRADADTGGADILAQVRVAEATRETGAGAHAGIAGFMGVRCGQTLELEQATRELVM